MKRWPFAVVLFFLMALPTVAQEPIGIQRRVASSTVRVQYLAFPTIIETTVTRNLNPHMRVRIDVQGDEWQFALVQRRWGWELDTALTEEKDVRALMYASLDYLGGDREALEIFTPVDPQYVLLLDGFAAR